MRQFVLIAPLLALALAACGSHASDQTTVTLNTDEGGANIVAEGGHARATVNLPGFSGSFKIPKLHIKAENVDFHGVHLYPGSDVTAMNLATGDESGAMKLSFESPAKPEVVREWFQQRLNGAGYSVKDSPTGLAGTDPEGKDFRLDLTPVGGDKSRGVITAS